MPWQVTCFLVVFKTWCYVFAFAFVWMRRYNLQQNAGKLLFEFFSLTRNSSMPLAQFYHQVQIQEMLLTWLYIRCYAFQNEKGTLGRLFLQSTDILN